MALPDFIDISDPTRNLAGFAQLDALAQDAPTAVTAAQKTVATPPPPLAPTAPRTLYRAWDGEPVAYSSDCDPLTAEPELSGVLVPDFLEDNRIEMGQSWALPLLLGVAAWKQGGGPLLGALGVLAAYMAPLPTAAVIAGMALYGNRFQEA